MVKKVLVGEKVELPSGRAVSITVASDPSRPWRPHARGNAWLLRRENAASRVHEQAWQVYEASGLLPLELDKGDAAALAQRLNLAKTPAT